MSRAERKALADVRKGGVRGLIRKVRIRSDAADGTIGADGQATLQSQVYRQQYGGNGA